jgi:hypothetical protein
VSALKVDLPVARIAAMGRGSSSKFMQLSPDIIFEEDGGVRHDWLRVRESYGLRWCLARKRFGVKVGGIREKTEQDELRVDSSGKGWHVDDLEADKRSRGGVFG